MAHLAGQKNTPPGRNGSRLIRYGAVLQFWTQRAVYASPTLAGETVYIGGNDSNLYALDAKNGHLKWQFATSGRIESLAMVAGDRVYFGSDDGLLYALGPGEGK